MTSHLLSIIYIFIRNFVWSGNVQDASKVYSLGGIKSLRTCLGAAQEQESYSLFLFGNRFPRLMFTSKYVYEKYNNINKLLQSF